MPAVVGGDLDRRARIVRFARLVGDRELELLTDHAGEGPIGKLHEGDVVSLDSEHMTLTAEVPDAEWNARGQWRPDPRKSAFGFGRELFGSMRSHATQPEQGAITLLGAA